MKVESIKNNNYQDNSRNNISFQELKETLTSAAFDELVQKKLDTLLTQTNSSLDTLQKQAASMPTGALKTALNGAIGALNEKKESLAAIFKDVITYSTVGMWQMAKSNMDNINATQNCQNHMMSLDQMVETAAQAISNEFTTNVLQADITNLNKEVNGGSPDPNKVNALTTQFNLDNTKMSTLGTFFSGINNLLNNGISSIAQNISVDVSNLTQGFQKYCDLIAQSLQAQ